MSKDWHSGHFCCWNCDESLTGQRYVLRDEHPYCIKCYESVFANTCEECNTIIGIDSKVSRGGVKVNEKFANFRIYSLKDLSYKDKHWHEACFLCQMCRISLVDKQFGSKSDKIYCGNCYDSQFASRCDGCGEVFRAGECSLNLLFSCFDCKVNFQLTRSQIICKAEKFLFEKPDSRLALSEAQIKTFASYRSIRLRSISLMAGRM